MSRGTVLIVDDDPIVLEVTRERLSDAGYHRFHPARRRSGLRNGRRSSSPTSSCSMSTCLL